MAGVCNLYMKLYCMHTPALHLFLLLHINSWLAGCLFSVYPCFPAARSNDNLFQDLNVAAWILWLPLSSLLLLFSTIFWNCSAPLVVVVLALLFPVVSHKNQFRLEGDSSRGAGSSKVLIWCSWSDMIGSLRGPVDGFVCGQDRGRGRSGHVVLLPLTDSAQSLCHTWKCL